MIVTSEKCGKLKGMRVSYMTSFGDFCFVKDDNWRKAKIIKPQKPARWAMKIRNLVLSNDNFVCLPNVNGWEIWEMRENDDDNLPL